MPHSSEPWISITDQPPPPPESIAFARPDPLNPGHWRVGIAYWTVSGKWNPEIKSEIYPEGFTHWLPLPKPPSQ